MRSLVTKISPHPPPPAIKTCQPAVEIHNIECSSCLITNKFLSVDFILKNYWLLKYNLKTELKIFVIITVNKQIVSNLRGVLTILLYKILSLTEMIVQYIIIERSINSYNYQELFKERNWFNLLIKLYVEELVLCNSTSS